MNKYRHRQLTLALILLCAGVEFFGVQAYAYGSQAMMDGLRLTRTEFAFASTVYTVGCILAIFKQHWLVTRYGYRSFLLYSLALYGVASLACALSTSLTMLSVMRFFQGLGGGALFLSSRLMVSVLLDQRDFFTGIKWMSHGMYVVPIGAPLLSGWMIQEYGWPGIFYLMAALSVPTWWIARQALFHYRATDLTEKHSPLAALAFAGGVFLLEFIIQEYAWIAEQPRRSSSCANNAVSSAVQPPSTQSVPETRTVTGRSAGNASRTSSNTSSGNRIRLSRLPPYSSPRRLEIGERNSWSR